MSMIAVSFSCSIWLAVFVSSISSLSNFPCSISICQSFLNSIRRFLIALNVISSVAGVISIDGTGLRLSLPGKGDLGGSCTFGTKRW